jgi:methylated-DNA-[protein]-cysteine S-methyltransferase
MLSCNYGTKWEVNLNQTSSLFSAQIPSILGQIRIDATEQSILGIYFVGQRWQPAELPHATQALNAVMNLAQRQLTEYFAGERRAFDLPLAPVGTDFQKQVWQQIAQIPFGQVVSYGSIAQTLNMPAAARAVGAATGKNPISVMIPCHRVVGSTGALTGYAGGLDRKTYLLNLEGSQPSMF